MERDATTLDARWLALTGRPGRMLGLVTLVWLGLLGLRVLAPPDLMDNDQERPAAYALDAVEHGRWLVQYDHDGKIMSKPPFSTWLTTPALWAFGESTHFLLALPSALATLTIAWLILLAGVARFSRAAALIAALLYLLSYFSQKQIFLLRSDPVFALTVWAGALAAWRAWERGRGWWLFWALAAAATLTKGPLGLVLAAGGLLARLGERGRSDAQRLRGAQWPGLLLYVGLCLGWFLAAWWVEGAALIDKMIRSELLGHAMGRGEGGFEPDWYKSPLYFLGRFAPWSLFTVAALWRVWRRPDPDHRRRRFENFLFAQFGFGALLFAFTSERGDHLLPLLPAASLLAGREIALRLGRLRRAPGPALVLGPAVLLFFAGIGAYHALDRAGEKSVRQTLEVEAFAETLAERVGRDFPLTHAGSTSGLQVLLHSWRERVSSERAVELLARPVPAFVVTHKPKRILEKLDPAIAVHTLLDAGPDPAYGLTLLSNVERLGYHRHMALASGPLTLELDGLQLRRWTAHGLRLWARRPTGALTLRNDSDGAIGLHYRIDNCHPPLEGALQVAPGAVRRLEFGTPPAPDTLLRLPAPRDALRAAAQLEALDRTDGPRVLLFEGTPREAAPWRCAHLERRARALGMTLCFLADAQGPPPGPDFLNRYGAPLGAAEGAPALLAAARPLAPPEHAPGLALRARALLRHTAPALLLCLAALSAIAALWRPARRRVERAGSGQESQRAIPGA